MGMGESPFRVVLADVGLYLRRVTQVAVRTLPLAVLLLVLKSTGLITLVPNFKCYTGVGAARRTLEVSVSFLIGVGPRVYPLLNDFATESPLSAELEPWDSADFGPETQCPLGDSKPG